MNKVDNREFEINIRIIQNPSNLYLCICCVQHCLGSHQQREFRFSLGGTNWEEQAKKHTQTI